MNTNKEHSFLKKFPVIGHPTKDEVAIVFHAFSEHAVRYCKVLVLNETLPEFIFKFDKGLWQLREDKEVPVWFNKTQIGTYLNGLLIGKS